MRDTYGQAIVSLHDHTAPAASQLLDVRGVGGRQHHRLGRLFTARFARTLRTQQRDCLGIHCKRRHRTRHRICASEPGVPASRRTLCLRSFGLRTAYRLHRRMGLCDFDLGRKCRHRHGCGELSHLAAALDRSDAGRIGRGHFVFFMDADVRELVRNQSIRLGAECHDGSQSSALVGGRRFGIVIRALDTTFPRPAPFLYQSAALLRQRL